MGDQKNQNPSTLINHKERIMLNQIMRFVKEEDGATAVEYGLMVSLIALAIIVSVTAIGNGLNTVFNNVAGSLPGGS
jgi:pilus assembly protein Flp/PilA